MSDLAVLDAVQSVSRKLDAVVARLDRMIALLEAQQVTITRTRDAAGMSTLDRAAQRYLMNIKTDGTPQGTTWQGKTE